MRASEANENPGRLGPDGDPPGAAYGSGLYGDPSGCAYGSGLYDHPSGGAYGDPGTSVGLCTRYISPGRGWMGPPRLPAAARPGAG